MNIVFFDFDGTITSKDSLADFIIYYAGYKKFIACIIKLVPSLVMYKIKIIPNWKAKEHVLKYFFGGMSVDKFNAIASDYSNNRLQKIIKGDAVSKINEHKKNGDKVVIVSASIDAWLRPWCELHGLELICTKLEAAGSIITGRISGKNCYGPEKVKRIKEDFDLSVYDRIFAYGDSAGDKEMLMMADIKYYKWHKV